jgi:hypothetical protein
MPQQGGPAHAPHPYNHEVKGKLHTCCEASCMKASTEKVPRNKLSEHAATQDLATTLVHTGMK